MAPKRIIFGCGYLGGRVAARWSPIAKPFVVTRSAGRASELRLSGHQAIVADVTKLQTLDNLPSVDAVLFAVGFDRTAGCAIEDVYAGGLANVLAALPPSVSRVVYISTTGVYGPHAGEWVDEQTPPDPQRDGGRASLAAEQVLAGHPLGRRSVVLRMAGLYGPGRVPHLDKLRAGGPLPVPRDGWLNLIHVDDAARIVVAADQWLAKQPAADRPHVFCVSDGAPVLRGEYYAEVARVLGTPPPCFTPPPPDSPAAARAAANRRVRNERMIQTLGVKLAYPTYREGLASILRAE